MKPKKLNINGQNLMNFSWYFIWCPSKCFYFIPFLIMNIAFNLIKGNEKTDNEGKLQKSLKSLIVAWNDK